MRKKRGTIEGGAKRSLIERERDLVEITRMYLDGKTQTEIAETLSSTRPYTLSRVTITNDLTTIRQRWREDTTRGMDELKSEQLAKIDDLERIYRERFEASRGEKKRTTSSHSGRAGNAGQIPTPSHVSVSVVTENSDGDDRWLSGIQWCIEQRCRILGLIAPTRLANADGGNIPPITMTSVVAYLPDNGRAVDSPDPIAKRN